MSKFVGFFPSYLLKITQKFCTPKKLPNLKILSLGTGNFCKYSPWGIIMSVCPNNLSAQLVNCSMDFNETLYKDWESHIDVNEARVT